MNSPALQCLKRQSISPHLYPGGEMVSIENHPNPLWDRGTILIFAQTRRLGTQSTAFDTKNPTGMEYSFRI